MECTIYRQSLRTPLSDQELTAVVELVGKALKKEGSLSLHVVRDAKVRGLNRLHRGEDTTTDVLSFPLAPSARFPGTAQWGDIFISWPQIKRQAYEYGVSEREELVRIVIHGLLHLFGYDHASAPQAKRMFALQERLLERALAL